MENEVNRMREDAARRMREMQSRARFPAQRRENEEKSDPPAAPTEGHEEKQLEEAQPKMTSALENLFKDKERTIILALLLLLSSEGGNHELIFALMFLLM